MFAFSQIQPRTGGNVSNNIEVGYGNYLGASMEQGFHDSAFASVMRMTENNIYDDGTKISSQEANQKYGLPTLTFNEPVNDTVARLMNQRKRAELDRSFMLEHAKTDGGRWIPGFGATMLGQLSNPLDMGLLFVPVVGEEAAAERLATQSALRRSLARGLFTSTEAIGRTGLPAKLTTSMIQGSAQAAISEIPLFISNTQDHANYEFEDAFKNVLGSGLFAGTLHLGMDYFLKPMLNRAGELYKALDPATKEAMSKQAINDFLKGENMNVHDYVDLDENVLRQRAAFNEDSARLQAVEELKAKGFDKPEQFADLLGTDHAPLLKDFSSMYEQAVNDIIDKKRAEYDPEKRYSEEREAEIARQQADGRILPDHEIRANTHEEIEKSSASIDKDIENLSGQKTKGVEIEKFDSLDEAIDQALDCIDKFIK